MKSTLDIPWKRYALIAELAKKLDSVSPQFGKTALQKLVYLLQEVYNVDCGYDFELYSYGPFDAQLISDLDLVAHWGCVSIESKNAGFGGYLIRPTDKVDTIREKASDFLDDEHTSNSINELISTYGSMTAREMELRATSIYVERNLRSKKEPYDRKKVRQLISQIKPKFDISEIDRVLDELSNRKHVELSY